MKGSGHEWLQILSAIVALKMSHTLWTTMAEEAMLSDTTPKWKVV